MSESRGAFFAIEGSDGSGKATQVDLLKKRLEKAGYEVELLAFPRYDQPSSHFVRQYLKGAYGHASTINPYTASLFYALDRYEAAPIIKKALAEGKIVLADRYTGSNMAHQGSKFPNPAERRGFFVWAESTEYQLLGIPRPNLNIFLRVPAEVSVQLMAHRVKDQHESNFGHLKSAVETYDMICQLFAVDYKSIDCVRENQLMSREEIHSHIWQTIAPLLPPPPLINNSKKAVNSKKRTVKPAKSQVKPITESADKLQWQIDGISLIAAFGLQQAGLKVELDFKNHWAGAGTTYKYAVPEGLDQDALKVFTSGYDTAADLYKKLYEKLANVSGEPKKILTEQLKLALPMGAVFSAKVEVDKFRAAAALQKLKSQPNHEISSLQSSLSFALDRKNIPAPVNAGYTSKPEPMNAILDKLAQTRPDYGADLEALRIIEFNPRNEFELIADSIYSQSSLTREEIMLALDRLTYDQKTSELKKALAKPAVLKLPSYRFDALTDWLTISEAINSDLAVVTDFQQLTVRYGYDVPSAIESAGLEDEYMEIFDHFLDLYSRLQRYSDEDVTQYATLAGNKVRWQARISAEDLKLAAGVRQTYLKQFVDLLTAKVKEIHPLTAEELMPAQKKPKTARRRRSSSRKK